METSINNPEYFNLYIRYKIEGANENGIIVFSALTRSEIEKYFNYIEQNKLGLQPIISNAQINVVEPLSFSIYDFSKATKDSNFEREDFAELVRKNISTEQDYRVTYRKLGKDVSNSFQISLEDVLKKMRKAALPDFMKNVGIDSDWNASDDFQPDTSNNVSFEEKKPDESGNTSSNTERKGANNPSGVKVTIKGSSFISGKLSGKLYLTNPIEYNNGIIDSSIAPAFNVHKIASVFANQLKNLKNESGQMVGVFGKWGRGKTYFVNEVCKHLGIVFEKETSGAQSDFIFIKFQAWKYQTTPSTWAYLFETIIDKYLDVKWYNKLRRIIRFSLIRKGHWNSWVKPLLGIFLCAIWFIIIPWLTQNASLIEAGKWAGGIGALLIVTNKIVSVLKLLNKPAIKLFDSLTKIPSFKSVLGIQAEVQKELVFLIKAFSQVISNKRILLFIDDLDRCSEESMIEIIDALRVILDDSEINKKIIVLVAVDESKLKKAIEFKYKARRSQAELIDISKEYIDKLFISALKLPSIAHEKFGEFIESIANQINYPDGKKREVQIDDQTHILDEDIEDVNQSTNPNDVQEKETLANSENTIESTIKLNENEIRQLKDKLSSVTSELTPRQIRIVFFRYLLARNLWKELSEKSNFEIGKMIDYIVEQTLSASIDKNPDSDELYDEIVQMVVAY
jgi:hypothetical protein